MNPPLAQAIDAMKETAAVDFKAGLDVDNKGQWLEILKDLAAIANTGGGLILIGLDDAGTPTGYDVARILDYDVSRIGDKLRKYTGVNFGGVALLSVARGRFQLAGIQVSPSAVPLVFTADGQYLNEHNQERFAFRQGTVYFRHGAKSEPGTSDDLRAFLERELERVKTSWLGGIRQVVEAPVGSTITVAAPTAEAVPHATVVRLVANESAEPCKLVNPDDTHPYRQCDLVDRINVRLTGKCSINRSNIQDVRKAHQTDSKPQFYWKGIHTGSQFSEAFIDWIVGSYENDPCFFQKAHAAHRSMVIAQNDERRQRISARSPTVHQLTA
jgi:hypothetical protein